MFGAALGAIGAIGSSILGNAANASLNSSTRNWQTAMYREDREYNTPENQVKRLRAAGINPQLAMSNGLMSAGSSTMPSAPSTHSYDFSPVSQGISNSVALYQQKRVQDAEIEYKNQQSENMRLQNITQLYRDIEQLENLKKTGELTSEQKKMVQAEIQSKWIDIQSQSERNEVEIDKLKSEKAVSDAQTSYINAQLEQQRIINQFTPRQQTIITSNLAKEGVKIDSEVNKNNRDSAVAIAEEALKRAQKSGVDITNQQIKEMSEYVVDEAFYKKEEQKYKAAETHKRYRLGDYTGRVAPSTLSNVRIKEPQKRRGKASISHSGVR